MIDVHKQSITHIGDYAIQHHTLPDQRQLVEVLRATADRIQRSIDRSEAAPKHGILAYIGKSPEEIEAIKAEIEADAGIEPGGAA